MNTIVIVANGLQAGSLGCYGNEWIRTPALDRFAAESVVFDQCFVESPQPQAVHRSWWTGRFARPSSPEFDGLPSESVLNLLQQGGVRTGLVSDSRLLGDVFVKAEKSTGMLARWISKLRGSSSRFGFNDVIWVPTHDGEEEEAGSLAKVVEAGVGWLDRVSRVAPFLLWLECSAPLSPWRPPQKYRDLYQDTSEVSTRALTVATSGVVGETVSEEELEELRQSYAATLTFLDTWLGRFFEKLETLGYLEETLLLVHSSHGVALGEHDTVGCVPPRVLEEMVHVPLLLRLPGGKRGGTRSLALVQSPDVAATLLDAFDVATPPAAPRFHGSSLLPLARGEVAKLRDYAVSWVRSRTQTGETFEEWSLRTQGWHLVLPVHDAEQSEPPPRQLFIKPEDRWDFSNVADQHIDAADQLELALRRFEGAVDRDEIDAVAHLREAMLVLAG